MEFRCKWVHRPFIPNDVVQQNHFGDNIYRWEFWAKISGYIWLRVNKAGIKKTTLATQCKYTTSHRRLLEEQLLPLPRDKRRVQINVEKNVAFKLAVSGT